MNSYLHGQLIYNKKRQEYTMRTASSINSIVNLDGYMHEVKLVYFIVPYTNVNSKWLQHLTVRPETIKLLEKNRQYTLRRTGLGWVFSLKGGGKKQNKPMVLCQTKKHWAVKGNSAKHKGSLPNKENIFCKQYI